MHDQQTLYDSLSSNKHVDEVVIRFPSKKRIIQWTQVGTDFVCDKCLDIDDDYWIIQETTCRDCNGEYLANLDDSNRCCDGILSDDPERIYVCDECILANRQRCQRIYGRSGYYTEGLEFNCSTCLGFDKDHITVYKTRSHSILSHSVDKNEIIRRDLETFEKNRKTRIQFEKEQEKVHTEKESLICCVL